MSVMCVYLDIFKSYNVDNSIRFYFNLPYTVKKKKYFQDLLSQHYFFCQINLNNLFSSDNLLF